MPLYDTESFDPPAPLARVILRNPLTRQQVADVPMLLDTGSDTTLLPVETVKALGIAIHQDTTVKLNAFDGNPSESAIVEAHLLLEGFAFRGKFVLIDRPIGIIGRDLLNLLLLTLDGTRLTWNLQNPRSTP